jgi:uncharacterized membrane protein
MTWQFFVILSVILFSLNGLFHRVLMRDTDSDPYAQTIAFYGLVGVFAFTIAIIRGGFHYSVSLQQVPFFIAMTIFATAAPVFGFKAIKLIQASENSILLSSQRLWILLGAFFFLREAFSISKLLGTLFILVGIAIAQWKKQKFVMNEGVLFSLLAALSYAIAEIISYYILRDFEAASFTVFVSLLPVLALLIIKPKTIQKLRFYLRPKYAINIALVSLNDTLATLFLFFAYQTGRNASQIAPIMATQTIISVLLAIIFLKERNNMVKKIVGAVMVVIGVILVL